MKQNFSPIIIVLLLIFISLTACQSAKAVQAETSLKITVAALETLVNAKPTDLPTATVIPTEFPTSTPTLEPTEIPPFTAQPELIITPTQTSPACTDLAEMEKHLSISDGSILKKLTLYAKVWRLKNTGTCTWTTQYKLVFTGGNFIIEQPDAQMPLEVPPGQSVELKVNFITPSVGDTYVASWLLENASGARFGVGPTSDQPIGLNFNIPKDSGVRKSC